MALVMKAERTSETSVNFNQITRRQSSEDSHRHTYPHENLKPHQIKPVHIMKPCLLTINVNIKLPSKPRSLKLSLLFTFSN
jgi:hypothetical protein